MRAVLAALALLLGLLVSPSAPANATTDATSDATTADTTTDLAAGKTATAGSFTDVYRAANVTDGDQATYWESANNAFPQWVQVDLGARATVNRLVLTLPTGWQSRTQTLSVQGSADGTAFTTLVPAATHTFAPSATLTLSPASARYVRLLITANSRWPAGQLAEFEVYGESGGGGDGTNLATGKPIAASSHTHTYVAAHANDGDVGT
ncbi:MAG: glycosyl hydrolase, partial [Nonomuraea muscovyensis]|nr:glycosyl hydrolase [Nonomuraea muscovyensis]